ncbi:hypothetical protein COW46_01560 [Candidatus Gracilibacteria bacterium CG17_big_fil_post_rev_8_21_14_2_50_48_13]|nr:MAG: hypothetical protein COW46_01560 [Candidatus Gracilibacteria bacterium CG17_big_fil_post_rev_8_21_14_2_50_48_13]
MKTSRVVIAALLFGCMLGVGSTFAIQKTFTDIRGDEWFAASVEDLSTQNVLKGYEDGSFKPNQTITRAEASVMLSRLDGILKSYTFNNFIQLQEEMKLLSYAEARAVALLGPCGEAGEILNTPEITRTEDKIWKFTIKDPKPMCQASCAVNATNADSEILWRCTGVIPENPVQ